MINILVTLNLNYMIPLQVLLKSMFVNNPGEDFAIYLMYSDIPQNELDKLNRFTASEGQTLIPIHIHIEDAIFENLPTPRHYTKEMYFRLLAHLCLPESLDRILYLDPDIVVINPVTEFYRTDFQDCAFVAAEHILSTRYVRMLNNLRLKTPYAKGYFNTGVLLINLAALRKEVTLSRLQSFIVENKMRLLLPDQDIFNAFYWDKIKPADYKIYNYDARYYEIIPKNIVSLEWIKQNTVFIHYCGKRKPWHKNYRFQLGSFYRQYEQMLKVSGKPLPAQE